VVPNLQAQQEEVKALHELLGMDTHLVTVALDIDPNEQAGDLKVMRPTISSVGFTRLRRLN
jgi:hypothetical protein